MSSNDSSSVDLAALIGSRICHDLISPIGAIGNGLELLSMAGGGGPEMSLIAESVENANARIRFFRIAFGHAAAEQSTARSEILSILQDTYAGTRLDVDWKAPGDCRRAEAKAAFLALQCVETALPFGGRVQISCTDGRWDFSGEGRKLKLDDPVWNLLDGGTCDEVLPKHIQFALLPAATARIGRTLAVEREPERIALRF